MKASIRKAGDRWVLTRPAFGFATSDEVTVHDSWKAAREALLGGALSSAGPIVEQGEYTLPQLNDWGCPHRGTIRMEDTA